jgi:isoleucyl-tRNA synthetase
LQAELELPATFLDLLDPANWAEVAIVSGARPAEALRVVKAPGQKCARCWRVLDEVGTRPAHPDLCVRCDEVVSTMPRRQEAAE